MRKLRVGVVGVGFIGKVHIEQLRRLGSVDVVAITDNANAETVGEELFIPNSYSDYKEMIDNENLDCIHICTPNNTHYEIAMYAMKQNVNVVCEKPMATTYAEAKEMRDYAKKHGLVNAINFNCRFYPMIYQMREMVKNGDVGDVFSIHGAYLQDWLYLDTDYSWRLEPDKSGNSRAFADIGSHWIDAVQFVTGLEVEEVLADFEVFHKTRRKPKKAIATYSGMSLRPEDYQEVKITTEDYATVLFHFKNGSKGCCNIHQMFAGRKNQITASVAGSKCSMHWDSECSNALWIGHRETFNEEAVKDPSVLADNTKKVISYPGGHVEGFPDTFKQGFAQIYAKISDKQNVTTDFATFNDGMNEMKLIEKIVESANSRNWVKVD